MNSSKAWDAHLDHAARLAERGAYRSNFDRALCALLNLSPRTGITGLTDGRRAAMRQALDGRATYQQIRDWRQGYRRAPAWAVELLNHKIEARETELRLARSA